MSFFNKFYSVLSKAKEREVIMNDAKCFSQDLHYLANQIKLNEMDEKEWLYQLIRIIVNLSAGIKSKEQYLIKNYNHHVLNKS